MIKGIHTMFYSSQPEALRAFVRDTLGFSYTDVGEGWLIFDLPEAEMGVHPADDNQPHAKSGTHDISLYCDDIEATVSDLKAKGVEFTTEVVDQGYGMVTSLKMPGDLVVQLYQPKYTKRVKESEPGPKARGAARRKGARKMKRGGLNRAAKKKVAKKKAPARKRAKKKLARRRR